MMKRTPRQKGTDPLSDQEEDTDPVGPRLGLSPNSRADRAERDAAETRDRLDQLVLQMDSWKRDSKERECDIEDQRQYFETQNRTFEDQRVNFGKARVPTARPKVC